MSVKDQLVIPEAVSADPKSFEVLRVWVANKKQHVSIRACTWNDPAAWGIMLADLAGHMANAFGETGMPRDQALKRIRAGLEAELNRPTDRPIGHTI
jgi:hypothetical protein